MTEDDRPHAPAPRDAERLTTLAALLREAGADLRQAEPPPALRRTVLAHHRIAAGAARALPAQEALATGAAGTGTASATATAAGWAGASGPRGPAGSPWMRWAAIAAGLLVLLLVAGQIGRGLLPPGTLRPPAWRGGPPPLPSDGLFVPVGSGLPRLNAGGQAVAWLVPTELPGDRLALLGLPFDPARAGERIPAELLLDGSGNVLAVRVAGVAGVAAGPPPGQTADRPESFDPPGGSDLPDPSDLPVPSPGLPGVTP